MRQRRGVGRGGGGASRRWHLGEDPRLLPTLVSEKVLLGEDSKDKSPEPERAGLVRGARVPVGGAGGGQGESE